MSPAVTAAAAASTEDSRWTPGSAHQHLTDMAAAAAAAGAVVVTSSACRDSWLAGCTLEMHA
jgi:hypothetical protein